MIYVLDMSDRKVYNFESLESMKDFEHFMGGPCGPDGDINVRVVDLATPEGKVELVNLFDRALGG